jgi:hypothetical protein
LPTLLEFDVGMGQDIADWCTARRVPILAALYPSRTVSLSECSIERMRSVGYAHQLRKVGAFASAVQGSIATTDLAILHTFREMVVVAVVAYLEEFLTCVVGLASFHRPPWPESI